ncbi:MAG: AraC family transcriptional regulator ligand-binding domain-containing protein [Myxococcota bacterium]
MCTDLGIDPNAVLRRAELPRDLWTRSEAWLSTEEYFRMYQAMEEESGDPELPLRLGSSIPVEAFAPPIFAALCSDNYEIAMSRLSHYKILIASMVLHVESDDDGTSVSLEWIDKRVPAPPGLEQLEVIFFVQLARLGTRHRVVPTRVTVRELPRHTPPYEEYLGIKLTQGERPSVSFTAEDARRPFLTANEAMWNFFEGDLRRRLADLSDSATVADRVRAALLELLPSGATSVQQVAKRLGLSTRTLQRRLANEAATYQGILDATRESLARHYLTQTTMTGAEISFLLGYEDPNSFSRAFNSWTGTTPERARASLMS